MSDENETEKKSASPNGLLDFLMATKKWWIIPILMLVFLIAAIVILSASSISPFIYSLF